MEKRLAFRGPGVKTSSGMWYLLGYWSNFRTMIFRIKDTGEGKRKQLQLTTTRTRRDRYHAIGLPRTNLLIKEGTLFKLII